MGDLGDGCSITEPRPVPASYRPVVQSSLGCPVDGHALPHADPGDPQTTAAGVRVRAANKPPIPDAFEMDEFRMFVRSRLKELFQPLRSDADLSVETWLSKCKYPKSRKVELARKWAKVVDIFDHSKHYGNCKCFAKDETYVDYKHARGIYSRSDEFKCAFGPVIKAIEEQIYKNPAFIKHVPVAERPKYIQDLLYRVGYKYWATDYTAYESLFTELLMECVDFELFEYMISQLPNSDWFRKFEGVLAGDNVCEFKHFTAIIRAKRMSGEMSTSLFNGFANFMIQQYVLSKYCGLPVEHQAGVVEGDDGLTRVPPDATYDPEVFTRLGLNVKLEEHLDLCSASFCGLIFDPQECINVTDPLEVLAQFGWTTARYHKSNKNTKNKLLRCKALSYLHQYPGCPIIQSLANYGLRMTRSTTIDHFVREKLITSLWEREQLIAALSVKWNDVQKPVGPMTRLLVESKYRIPVELQYKIEAYLDGLDELVPLQIPGFDMMTPQSWRHYWCNYVMVGYDLKSEVLPRPVMEDFVREW